MMPKDDHLVRSAMHNIEIRPALAGDAKAIADFHVRIWRETYVGIAPVEAVEQLDEAHRLRSWTNALTSGKSGLKTFIATADNLVGSISFGPSTNDVFQGLAEIKHLYVDSAYRGHGMGRLLMNTAFRDLSDQAYSGVGLAVVEENLAARAFYSTLGGTEIGKFIDPGPLWKSTNVLVSWSLKPYTQN